MQPNGSRFSCGRPAYLEVSIRRPTRVNHRPAAAGRATTQSNQSGRPSAATACWAACLRRTRGSGDSPEGLLRPEMSRTGVIGSSRLGVALVGKESEHQAYDELSRR